MSTTFVCLENPYEVPTSTLCWSTSQIVELAPNLPSIKLPLSGHVSGSHDAGNHINPKLGFLKHLDMKYETVWKVEVKGNIPEGNHFALENYKSLANQSLMDDILNKVEKLKLVAAEFNVPMSQLAISWCAKNPNVQLLLNDRHYTSRFG
ncbi:unnamed protein product [Sphagnum balticum]